MAFQPHSAKAGILKAREAPSFVPCNHVDTFNQRFIISLSVVVVSKILSFLDLYGPFKN